ncbi:MAG: type II secretion system protein [Elusimicrobiota bacterium]
MRATTNPPSRSRKPARGGGFTLVELMIVVSILAVLASIAIPKFADLIQKSEEGSTKGNLASLRVAMSAFSASNQGNPPGCVVGPASTVFDTTILSNYITNIGKVNTGLHPPTNSVYCDSTLLPGSVHDGQGWYYDGSSGSIYVACDHTDTIGNLWDSY